MGIKKAWALIKADLKEARLLFGILLVVTFLFAVVLGGYCSKDLSFEKICLIVLRSFILTSGMFITSLAFVLVPMAFDPKYKRGESF